MFGPIIAARAPENLLPKDASRGLCGPDSLRPLCFSCAQEAEWLFEKYLYIFLNYKSNRFSLHNNAN